MFESMAALDGSGADYAVCYIDLDDFKVVNDLHGHLVGDEIIITVARRLRGLTRPGDLVARVGGDEFVVVFAGVDLEQARTLTARVVESLNRPAEVGGTQFDLGASVGLAARFAGGCADEVLAAADAALYRAKAAGRGTFAE